MTLDGTNRIHTVRILRRFTRTMFPWWFPSLRPTPGPKRRSGQPTKRTTWLIAFSTRVGLPTALEEVGLGGEDRDELMTVANAATLPSETIHNLPFAVDAEIVCDALIAADAYGRAFRQAARAEEHTVR